ncbi:MAG: helix-turn-helix transcriptional regulator [Bryobacterales bacterium]|nr:helix-turn-helix transcriptional regulator [Bryobacterales bacterium]
MSAAYASAPGLFKPRVASTCLASSRMEVPPQFWRALSIELNTFATARGFAVVNLNAELLAASEAFYRAETETNLFAIIGNRVRPADATHPNWAAELGAGHAAPRRVILSRRACFPCALIASPLRPDSAPPAILLRVAAAPRMLSLDAELLTALFDLTPAEMSIAECIAMGETIQEAAHRRGVSLNTAKTHLKRLFSKTGTRRQAELLRALLAGAIT